jgi:aquaporin Z
MLIGVAMGLTAIAIIYSPWGQLSGAHLNPAVTLTFLRLGKVEAADAAFYVIAQFAGGIAGTMLLTVLFGEHFTLPPIAAIATVPGSRGEALAFIAEVAIAFVLMTTVLVANASARLMRWTGVCAGVLLALYIMLEAPLSGMSLNPARAQRRISGAEWDLAWDLDLLNRTVDWDVARGRAASAPWPAHALRKASPQRSQPLHFPLRFRGGAASGGQPCLMSITT